MQLLVFVACTRGPSLREAIVTDAELGDFQLALIREKRRGRRPGWAKLKSALHGIDGAINLQWQAASATLQARIVTKAEGDPAPIAGDLVTYLLQRFPDRVQSINLMPRP